MPSRLNNSSFPKLLLNFLDRLFYNGFNAAFSGSDYSGSVLDIGIGYEDGGFYAQIGPSVLWVDGGETEVGFSGKTGVSASVSEDLSAYGEVSFAKYEDIDAGYGLKVGTKYSF